MVRVQLKQKNIKKNYKRFGELKKSPYICKTNEIGNDLDTSLSLFSSLFIDLWGSSRVVKRGCVVAYLTF